MKLIARFYPSGDFSDTHEESLILGYTAVQDPTADLDPAAFEKIAKWIEANPKGRVEIFGI